MSNNRLLTWGPNYKRSGGRWRKQIDGKVHYFGHANSTSDNKSYRKAEKAYLQLLDVLEKTNPITIASDTATAADIAEKFLQHQFARYERDEISSMYFEKCRCGLNAFVGYVGTETVFEQIGEMELEDYRDYALSRPLSPKTNRRISLRYAKDRLSMVKTFYRWSYKLYLLEHLPRNLLDYTKITVPLKPIKTYSIDELQTFWANATSRVRCYMALALNCGMGQQDISDLKLNEIDFGNGYIERKRSKTKVQAKHKLWDVTIELLKNEMNPKAKKTDPVFRTTNGQPLVWGEIINGRQKKGDSVRSAFWRLQNKTNINSNRGFYCLRKTGASIIEQIDPYSTEMYLSHSENGMKRSYAQRDWARLEKALEKMEKMLGLKL